MNTTTTKSKTKFIVLFGDFDCAAEEIEVRGGLFKSLKAAQKFVREEYLANHNVDDEDENPDLDFTDFLDDGHSFWRITEV